MPEVLIELKDVVKRFNDNVVLKDIDLQITQGDIFGLIGVSGAGKTTLLRSIIGFYRVDSGKILFKNKDIHENLKEIRKLFGFASQDNCFYGKLTVEENLKYFGKQYGLDNKTIKQRSDELLKLVELSRARKRLAEDLSGGMKRRLDLACAMIHDPKILICDEPAAGLDPLLRKHMWALIQEIAKRGTTIIISSHLLSEIETVCTKIAILHKGIVLEVDSPENLKAMYSRDQEIHLETFPGRYDIIADELSQHKDIQINYLSNQGHKLVIYTPQAEIVLHRILEDLERMQEKLLDVDVNKPTLEEVFEALTRKEGVEGTSEEELQDYVKKAYEFGYTRQQIANILSEQKWPHDMIKKSLDDIEEQEKQNDTATNRTDKKES